MKKIMVISSVLFLTVLLVFSATAQLTQPSTLNLTYDASGNGIHRHLTIIEIPLSPPQSKKIKSGDTTNTNTPLTSHEDSVNEEKAYKRMLENVKVYPNPTQTVIKIEIKVPMENVYTAILFDEKGTEIIRKTFNVSYCEIDISALQTADYFLHIVSNDMQISWKIIKN